MWLSFVAVGWPVLTRWRLQWPLGASRPVYFCPFLDFASWKFIKAVLKITSKLKKH
jgi:hypothetical protein